MANVMRGNRQCTPESLRADFNQWAEDVALETEVLDTAVEAGRLDIANQASIDREKALKRVDSVLDLYIDLGFLALSHEEA